MSQLYCVLDFETRSKANLKLVGAYEYANHPTTRILCVSWRIGTFEQIKLNSTETKDWSPYVPSPYGELKRALLDPKVILVAHNAFFEQVITRFVLSKLIHDSYLKSIPSSRWICTASMARALALPGKLEHACAAMKLPIQKDMEGHRLMLKMSKPRNPTKKNPKVWNQKMSDLLRLMAYCRQDVDAECALFTSIPMLSPYERKVWLLDQKMNWRGIRADRFLVQKIIGMIDQELKRFEKVTVEISNGELRSTAQRNATLKWMNAHGLALPNLQKKTVDDAIQAGLATGPAGELLRIRQDSSKTSTAKYQAFEMRSRTDGRVRDNLVYHAASTGRFGGSGLQPHNFPRPTLKEIAEAIEFVLEPDTDLEWVRLVWGNPLDLFSNLLRSMIIASEGKEFFSGDFAGIEVRVLFWIARHTEGLRAFREMRDLYCEMASIIYGIKVTKEDSVKRQLGKKTILGCGFQMGPPKFFETCKQDGMEVTEEMAAKAVKAYRTTHAPVVALWSNLEKAAIAAVRNKGKRYTINMTSWWVEGRFLFCQLPSGRKLAYCDPIIKSKPTPWGELRPKLYHWDVDPKTKKWVLAATYGGKLTENVVQAIARDLMVDGMFRSEDRGYELAITVHDELLSEKDKDAGSEKEFLGLMAELPPWAGGLPVNVEGWSGERYRK